MSATGCGTFIQLSAALRPPPSIPLCAGLRPGHPALRGQKWPGQGWASRPQPRACPQGSILPTLPTSAFYSVTRDGMPLYWVLNNSSGQKMVAAGCGRPSHHKGRNNEFSPCSTALPPLRPCCCWLYAAFPPPVRGSPGSLAACLLSAAAREKNKKKRQRYVLL